MNTKFFPFIVILLIAFASCNRKQDNTNIDVDTVNASADIAFDKAKIILYSLPSPVETSVVLENANIAFNPEIISQVNNLEFFSTTKAMAIALGIFTADMSYAGIYEQHQYMVEYMAACKTLSESLNIYEVVNDSVVDQLTKNINDKYKVIDIISEVYTNSNAFLEENERQEVAAMIMYGGWIEGLYLSLSLVSDFDKDTELVDMIEGQGLVIGDMIGLLSIYKENTDIKDLLADIDKINAVYKNASSPLNKKDFDDLYKVVSELRNSYLNISSEK